MAERSHTNDFSESGSGGQSPDAIRQKLFDPQLEAVRQPALDLAGELLTLLSALPRTFADSQRRELDRLMQSAHEQDPRVAALRGSIAQTNILQSTAQLGETRLKRVFSAYSRSGNFFHGFVSTPDLAPLSDRIVRLTGVKTLSATTEPDGYFLISVDSKTVPSREVKNEADSVEWQVEILRGNSVVYRDPAPVVLGEGNGYREYVVRE